MTRLPKLKVRTLRDLKLVEEVIDIEQAKCLFPSDSHILVEGNRVISYEELVQLAAQEAADPGG